MKRLFVSAVFTMLIFVTVLSGVFSVADRFAEDILYHRPDGTLGSIKIIGIDDETRAKYGEVSEWDRNIYAQLVDTLCVSDEVRPAVIGFDIIFDRDGTEKGDRSFAEACGRHGNVVCAYDYKFGFGIDTDGENGAQVNFLVNEGKNLPYEELRAVTRQGFVNSYADDKDGIIRMVFLSTDDGGSTGYSLNAEIYKAYAEQSGFEAVMPETDRNGMFFPRYSGKPGDYETVSLCDVLDGSVPAEAFDGCIVLVGICTAGMMDEHYVPTARGRLMFGVEVHANIIQALIEHKYFSRVPVWVSAAVCALLGGMIAYICYGLSVGGCTALCLSAAAVRLIAGGLMFRAGISGNVIIFPAFCVIITGYYTAAHYYAANRSRRQIENAFKKYVAPQIVEKIAKSGTYTLTLGGEYRDIAVLFVDIRGFTPLSESLEPAQVVDILNSYLELTTNCIFRYGGTLDKFIGDATMAVFNAPFDTEDYIFRALLTAWDIVAGGNAIEKEFMEKYGKAVGFGVGVNCGPAVVGNIGSSFRMDYTAIGDTVNTAARLEANAPRGTVYISGEVYEQVRDYINADEIGTIPLKGKSKEVFVYSVTAVDAERIRNEKNIDNTGTR